MGKLIGGDSSDEANRIAAEAAASAERARQAQANLEANSAKDLTTENIGTIVSGGTADVAATTEAALKKKKSASGGLASSLGINA